MVSYGIFVVLLFIFVAGIFTLIFAQMVNQTIDVVNKDIDNGKLSVKFTTWFDFIVGLCKAIPLFLLIGVTGWAIVRALDRRNSEGI